MILLLIRSTVHLTWGFICSQSALGGSGRSAERRCLVPQSIYNS